MHLCWEVKYILRILCTDAGKITIIKLLHTEI